MKKILVNYYAIIMIVLFIIYNLVLVNFKVSGLLYQIFMIMLIAVNIITLITFRKNIRYKSLVIIAYFFICLFSKDRLQYSFGVFSMVTLIITGFMSSHFIKVIAVLIMIFFCRFFIPLIFVYLLVFCSELGDGNDIYDNTHYFCENNYEIYSFSQGAMDKFHYSIGKYYIILDIDDIIEIYYNERNEVSQEEYEKYLDNHKCRWIGDINESR